MILCTLPQVPDAVKALSASGSRFIRVVPIADGRWMATGADTPLLVAGSPVLKVASANVDAGGRCSHPPAPAPHFSVGSMTSSESRDTSGVASLDAPTELSGVCECGRPDPSGRCSECEVRDEMEGTP